MPCSSPRSRSSASRSAAAHRAPATRLVIELARPDARAAAALAGAGVAHEALDKKRLTLDGADGAGLRALDALRAAGVAVRTFELQRPTLEETFLGVVRGSRRET